MKTFLPLTAFLMVTLAPTVPAQPPTIASPLGGTSPLGAAPAPPPADKVVATVDGKDVTYGELQSMLAIAPAAVQREPQMALQQYFIMRYLAAEGEKLKLAERSPLKEELEFQRTNVIAGAMLNFQRESSTVAPDAVEAYYKVHPEKYEQAKIKVIFVSFKPTVAKTGTTQEDLARAAQDAFSQAHSATDRSEGDAKALADEVVKKVRAGGDFLALVQQYSDDPTSKAAQGDFGVIKHDSTSYPEDLKKAVFALQVGQVGDPVRQATGFYIIRMEDKSPQPLSEVASDILQNLRQQNLNEWFTGLNKRFKPEIKDPNAFIHSGQPLGVGIAPASPQR